MRDMATGRRVVCALAGAAVALAASTAHAQWARLPPRTGDAAAVTINAIRAFPSGVAYGLGLGGVRSADLGTTWTRMTNPPLGSGSSITPSLFWRTDREGFLTGASLPSLPMGIRTAITRTADGGATWTPAEAITLQGSTADLALLQVSTPHFADATNGYVIGWYSSTRGSMGNRAVALRTTDGGRTWAEVASPQTGDSCNVITVAGESVHAFDASNVVASITFSCSAGGARQVVVRSSDAGATWAPVTWVGARHGVLRGAMHFVDAMEGIAVHVDPGTTGARLALARTTDAGRTWTVTEGPASNSSLTGISGVGRTVIAGDLLRRIWRSSDLGVTWTADTLPAGWPSSAGAVVSVAHPSPGVFLACSNVDADCIRDGMGAVPPPVDAGVTDAGVTDAGVSVDVAMTADVVSATDATSVTDVPTMPADVTTVVDAGTSAPPMDEGGCAVGRVGAGRSAGGVLLALGVLIAGRRRRRG